MLAVGPYRAPSENSHTAIKVSLRSSLPHTQAPIDFSLPHLSHTYPLLCFSPSHFFSPLLFLCSDTAGVAQSLSLPPRLLLCSMFHFRTGTTSLFALPCLALPCLALPCLALPCLALPCLALPCLALLCLALPCLALPCLALPCLALPCLALPCLALPCLALPCLALPCLVLPCLALS
jgi:hypothetical protein